MNSSDMETSTVNRLVQWSVAAKNHSVLSLSPSLLSCLSLSLSCWPICGMLDWTPELKCLKALCGQQPYELYNYVIALSLHLCIIFLSLLVTMITIKNFETENCYNIRAGAIV